MNKNIKNKLFVKEIFKILDKENFNETLIPVESSKVCVFDFRGYRLDSLKNVVHEGDWIKVGEPLLHLKGNADVQFCSLCSGKVSKVERADKRRIERIVLERDEVQKELPLAVLGSKDVTKETFVEHMNGTGCAFRVFTRPCKRVADLHQEYDALFVNAAKSLPYALPLSFQMKEHKEAIEAGLSIFKKFYPVHFVCTQEVSFGDDIVCHKASDNWQASLTSFHIHKIHPILCEKQKVLTIDLEDLIYCGYSFLGKWHTKKHVYLYSNEVKAEAKGIYEMQVGQTVDDLLRKAKIQGQVELVSADPLTGVRVDRSGAILPSDTVLTALLDQEYKRTLYHLRASPPAYTTSFSYFPKKGHACGNHLLFGEPRAFIAQEFYDHTMPLDLEIVPLIKAVLTEDYEKAVFLGLLEVDSEDFAQATFVCPSKIEMMQIIEEGHKRVLAELDL